jgi:hypothetical protein
LCECSSEVLCASVLVKSGLVRRTDHATPLYPQKMALTSQTSCGRSVGIVRSRTKATELVNISIFFRINLFSVGFYSDSTLILWTLAVKLSMVIGGPTASVV